MTLKYVSYKYMNLSNLQKIFSRADRVGSSLRRRCASPEYKDKDQNPELRGKETSDTRLCISV